MNGYLWRIQFVDPSDPMLMDRTHTQTVATTDPDHLIVYLSNQLRGDFLMRVVLHELGHCAIFSYDLLKDIHKMVRPSYWIEAEEYLCNFIADYGFKIFSIAYDLLGYDAWQLIPYELDNLLAAA